MTDVVSPAPPGSHRVRHRRRLSLGLALVSLLAGVVAVTQVGASASTKALRSVVKGSDGQNCWVTNHLVPSSSAAAAVADGQPPGHHEYLLVWAGDANLADTKGSLFQTTHLGI